MFFLINYEWTNPFLDWAMAVASSFEAWLPLLAAAVLFAWWRGGFRWRAFLVCAAAVFLVNDGVLTQLLKDTVRRPRPYEIVHGVRVVDLQRTEPAVLGVFKPALVKPSQLNHFPPAGRSYPSGHVANNFVLAVLLAVFFPPWGALYFVAACIVSYSRVYVGAHWPSDVAGSAAQGAGVALLIVSALEVVWRRYGARLLPTVRARHASLLGWPA